MRITLLDILLSSFFMLGIMSLTLGSVSLATPYTQALFGSSYFVIANVLLALLFYGLLSALVVRLLVKYRKLQVGEFEMDHPNFTYWKLLMMLFDMGRFALKPLTTLPVKPLIAALYGAKIGKNVATGGTIEDPFLVTIGNNSVIGNQTLVSGNMTNNGKIFFGTVQIGNNVTVGANSVVMPNVTIGDGAVIGIGSVLLPGTIVPAGESWRGNPARKWQ